MKKRMLALTVAFIMAVMNTVAALAVPSARSVKYPTPEGYNENDYQKVVSFLEIEDENGVKNGEKLCARLGTTYDPLAPWDWTAYSEEVGYNVGILFVYDYTYTQRLLTFLLADLFYMDETLDDTPCGDLDLSDCSALIRFEIMNCDVPSINLSGCKSMSVCYVYEQPTEQLDLTGCSALYNLDFPGCDITSVDVSDCTLLECLRCWDTPVEALDVSNCPKLIDLHCAGTGISSLDLSNNPELEKLSCYNTNISELDLSHNPKLQTVSAGNCAPLSRIDLSGCTELVDLRCSYSELTELDLSDCVSLRILFCGETGITSLDATSCPELYYLSCELAALTELDVTNCPLLSVLSCHSNRLTELDLSNNPLLPFDMITCDGNGNIGTGYSNDAFGAAAYGNEGYTFSAWYSEDGDFISDNHALFSDETEYTRIFAAFEPSGKAASPVDFAWDTLDYIDKPEYAVGAARSKAPDNYDEHDYQAVLAFLEIEDENGVKNGEKLCERLGTEYDPENPAAWSGFYPDTEFTVGAIFAADYTGRLRLQMFIFSDLFYADESLETTPTGEIDLSGCRSLARVDISGCDMASVDVSDCKALALFYCYTTPTERIYVDGCTVLYDLCFSGTDIASADVSDCVSLESLWCWETPLESLDVSGCPSLISLDCSVSNISELDVSNNPELVLLRCDTSNVTSLDLRANTKLEAVLAYYCPLESIDLTNCHELSSLYVHTTHLTELDVTGCPHLQELYCSECRIEELDLSNCPELWVLYCTFNELTELDLSHNPLLTRLACRGNHLTYLDCSSNPYIPFDTIRSVGNGNIGTSDNNGELYAVAYGEEGWHFTGWYTEEGELVSDHYFLSFSQTDCINLVAVFEPDDVIPGDANGDGIVDAQDALLVLRHALRLIELEPAAAEACDVNGDGVITMQDALLILRFALELIEEF